MTRPTIVELSRAEVALASLAGAMRETKNFGRDDAPGFDGTLGDHVDGAIAEVALAKLLGRYWLAVVDDFRTLDGDVGARVQVRWTKYDGPEPRLRVRSKDADGDAFVLVTGRPPRLRVWGWAFGVEAKLDEFLDTPDPRRPPCYFAPTSILRPIETLAASLDEVAA